MYLSFLFQLFNSNEEFWNENFILGHPTQFAEKVKNVLRERNNGRLNYNNHTYDGLIQLIYLVGMSLCSDIELKMI